jgi:hypothetical protein
LGVGIAMRVGTPLFSACFVRVCITPREIIARTNFSNMSRKIIDRLVYGRRREFWHHGGLSLLDMTLQSYPRVQKPNARKFHLFMLPFPSTMLFLL